MLFYESSDLSDREGAVTVLSGLRTVKWRGNFGGYGDGISVRISNITLA